MDRVMNGRRPRLAHACALAVVATCLASANASHAKPPKPEAECVRLFEWFSTLGFPDVKHVKFVRYPASVSQAADEPPQVHFEHGFLLGESKDAWTVLTFDAKPLAVEKRPKYPEKRPADWTCQADDLSAFAKATVAVRARPDVEEDSEYAERSLSKTTRLFFLAWTCWRKGLDEPATKLFAIATDLRDPQLGLPPGIATLRRRIAVDLAHEEFLEAQLDLNRDKPREQVLARLEAISNKFPGLETAFGAEEMARVLRPMVQEDREHAKKGKLKKPLAATLRKEQIAELIFDLRDQHGYSGNAFDERHQIVPCPPHPGETPAERLFKLGYEAVPQIIEALSDDRFSRTLEFRTQGGDEPRLNFRYHVQTVGDCALQILERLACREFYKRSDRFLGESPMLIAAVKKATLEWNDELQRELKQKGERQVLVDRMQVADFPSTQLAEPLLAKYPDAALPALTAAARKATDKQVMLAFVQLMDRAGGKELVPTLLHEFKTCPSLDERITLATLLLKHRRTDGVAPLIAEWKRSAGRSVSRDTLIDLAYYLARCGQADAVTILAQGLQKCPAGVRLAAVLSFVRSDAFELGGMSSNLLVFLQDGAAGDTLLPVIANDKVLFATVIKLLIAELEDTGPTGPEPGRWGEVHFPDPCIADVAAQVLHQHDARRYPFDLSAPRRDRDRQRVLLINAWRKTHNLPELPVPRPRVIAPIADDTLAPLLDRLQQAKGAAHDRAERDIEKLGPGAVAGILKRRDQLKPADLRRKDLERIARRLAHRIVEIQVADKSLKPQGKLAARLEALKDQSLDTGALVELVVGLTSELRLPAHGCRLHVSRAGPGSGVVLRVDLLDKARNDEQHDGSWPRRVPLRPDGFVRWQETLNAESKGESIIATSGGGTEADQDDLRSLGTEAFGIDLRKPVEIDIEYVGYWTE